MKISSLTIKNFRLTNRPILQKSIGGYFELELPHHEEYHSNCLRLNSGKNCIYHILKCRQYDKVYIPYYTCEIVLKPILDLGISYDFYHINDDLEIATEIKLQKNEALLYTNYYGLKQAYVELLAEQFGTQLIVDNSQAFFAKPLPHIDTFYTCRKFFGVPDGAYLYTDVISAEPLIRSNSYDRISHLVKRIDTSPEFGFKDYHQHEEGLSQEPPMVMSSFTQRMMQSIDYEDASKRRRNNYQQLQNRLQRTNLLKIPLGNIDVPMAYPYLAEGNEILRKHLIKNKIFVATYWPNVREWVTNESYERFLSDCLIPLPIDQRYGKEEMNFILNNISC